MYFVFKKGLKNQFFGKGRAASWSKATCRRLRLSGAAPQIRGGKREASSPSTELCRLDPGGKEEEEAVGRAAVSGLPCFSFPLPAKLFAAFRDLIAPARLLLRRTASRCPPWGKKHHLPSLLLSLTHARTHTICLLHWPAKEWGERGTAVSKKKAAKYSECPSGFVVPT